MMEIPYKLKLAKCSKIYKKFISQFSILSKLNAKTMIELQGKNRKMRKIFLLCFILFRELKKLFI